MIKRRPRIKPSLLVRKGVSTLHRFKRKRRAKRRIRGAEPKLWSLSKADKEFSWFIRTRDCMCQFPGCTVRVIEKLQCSHYFSRAKKSTRFDPDNCLSLCILHHFMSKLLGWEFQKQRKETEGWDGQYTIFMKTWLGPERYAALCERATQKMKQKEAIQGVMHLMSTGKALHNESPNDTIKG